MLKMLLGHWQAHREPLPFVLTDDPLYCSHLTSSPFPEVYSVNRVNPLFEEDEDRNKDDHQTILRSPSENETRTSVDTGYSSSEHLKSYSTEDGGSARDRQMSSDSEESSPVVIVAADVHRVSYPEDIIVLPSSSDNSTRRSISANSLSSRYESETSSSQQDHSFFDSLTMSSYNDSNSHRDERLNGETSSQTEVKRPLETNRELREKLKRLLEKGTEMSPETKLQTDSDIERTKNDLMESLSRALNQKVPKSETEVINHVHKTITRTDSAVLDNNRIDQHADFKEQNLLKPTNVINKHNHAPLSQGVTRQDESTASSTSNSSKRANRKHRPGKHNHHQQYSDKDLKRNSKSESSNSSDIAQSNHKCKLCKNTHRPMAFHQLLPGHWSYDNVYLPQITDICYHCLHHHQPHMVTSSDDSSMFYHRNDMARARHSWAPYASTKLIPEKGESGTTSSSKDGQTTSSSTRYSPDGTSQDTDNSLTDSNGVKRSLQERRSLRIPKKCKCDDCLAAAFDKDAPFPDHPCPCYCLSHRKVKFASENDVSQQRHHPLFHGIFHVNKDKLSKGEPINAAFVMNLPHLNGSVLNKSGGVKENGYKTNNGSTLVPRSLKEPIKMDELYRSYPINFRDWEAHYRRTYLKKRKKRALTMVGIAIGIILVVGVAVTMTFVFLRIKRPA